MQPLFYVPFCFIDEKTEAINICATKTRTWSWICQNEFCLDYFSFLIFLISQTIFLLKFCAVSIPSSSFSTSPFSIPNAIFQYVEPGTIIPWCKKKNSNWARVKFCPALLATTSGAPTLFSKTRPLCYMTGIQLCQSMPLFRELQNQSKREKPE